jgi:general secretion pathway protein G
MLSRAISLKRRCVTLIEMMIVMFLIALITGVIAYNYQGSLEKGKAFKSEAGIEKLQTILSLAVAESGSIDLSPGEWQKVVMNSPLVKDPNSLVKDGWGYDYIVSFDPDSRMITVSSPGLEAYNASSKKAK